MSGYRTAFPMKIDIIPWKRGCIRVLNPLCKKYTMYMIVCQFYKLNFEHLHPLVFHHYVVGQLFKSRISVDWYSSVRQKRFNYFDDVGL